MSNEDYDDYDFMDNDAPKVDDSILGDMLLTRLFKVHRTPRYDIAPQTIIRVSKSGRRLAF